MSWLERCPDSRGEIVHICIGTKYSVLIIQDVLISECPHLGIPLIWKKINNFHAHTCTGLYLYNYHGTLLPSLQV